ncbi:hypothetical protein D918_05529 [Trichuris suis]|nr:hypothetical protein D918_05529 [Trichuris suis]
MTRGHYTKDRRSEQEPAALFMWNYFGTVYCRLQKTGPDNLCRSLLHRVYNAVLPSRRLKSVVDVDGSEIASFCRRGIPVLPELVWLLQILNYQLADNQKTNPEKTNPWVIVTIACQVVLSHVQITRYVA